MLLDFQKRQKSFLIRIFERQRVHPSVVWESDRVSVSATTVVVVVIAFVMQFIMYFEVVVVVLSGSK